IFFLFQIAITLPDQAHLTALADSANVYAPAVLAIAWEETRTNMNPHVRGHHCWWSLRLSDSTLVVHHEKNCEVGRFQIKPSTARHRCTGLNIWTYEGNVRCSIKMLAEATR